MENKAMISRRNFMQAGAGVGMLAALGQLNLAHAAAPVQQDYKALVCLFMFGGNDGHNTVIPLAPNQYAAYQAARGGVGLPQNQILPISDAAQGQFGLHPLMPEMQALYGQGKAGVIANVGMLVQPTSWQQFQAGTQLPTQLRSHSDQVVQMQTGYPNTGGSTGWGGRVADLLQGSNAGSTFPTSIAIGGSALYCSGNQVTGINLQPGNYFDQNAMNLYPASAGQGRDAAQNSIVTQDAGNTLVNAANGVLAQARQLNPILKATANSPGFTTQFPSTGIGTQLKEIARIISLRNQVGVGRQVFFCSLGGFDTHSGQSYQQGYLLQQVSQALAAFYNATVELGIADKVTAFTMSDFGRSLQPSGSGTDHGWGSHHFVVGGAVQGGRIVGTFPSMTNYAAASANQSNPDYADSRGTLLPRQSLTQYGATLAKWFGATDAQLDGLFPTLPNFPTRDLGFLL